MNMVLVSPHFPPNFYNFAVAASRAGANVLGIGDAPYGELRTQLRQALTEYYRVDDVSSYESLIRACGYFTFHYGKIDCIESHNEHWLATDARLRQDFNVPGLLPADMAAVKRKSTMKRIFVSAGLDVPPGVLATALDDTLAFAETVGYPLVAKPDVGVGAARTHKIRSQDGLRAFWASKGAEPYVVEAFVRGELYSFDGLTDQEGRVLFSTAHTYRPSIMDVVNEDVDVCAVSFREVPPGLKQVGMRAVEAFDVRARFFHIEFFHVPDQGRWIALEMNMRPPGGPMMDVLNYANDIDLYREWVNVVMFNTFTAETARPYYCSFVGRKRHLAHAHSHRDILDGLGDVLVHHEPVPPVFARAMGHHAYVLRSPDRAVLQNAIDYILALVH
jgi:hypothetical protein